MKDYKRLTERDWHNAKFSVITHKDNRAVLHRLWELENKIERGELISTVQNEQGEQETAFFVKHDVKVCKDVVKECLQVLRDTRKPYPRDDYACGWNIGIGTAIERLTERYSIDVEDEE